MAVPIKKSPTDNVIELHVVDGKLCEKQKVKYNKDGSVNKRHPNKVAGVSSEVYPFTSNAEIKAMIDVFNKHIDEAPDDNKQQIACRNKMLFSIGINIGLRASDLCSLKFSHLMNDDGSFKRFFAIQPKKTKKTTGKFVKPFVNEAIQKAVMTYIDEYPIQDMNEYLFKSRVGDSHITEISLGRIIKNAAKEAGIEKNINSHSLRKTFGYHIWHDAVDKEKSLVLLNTIFAHSSIAITKKYIGIMDDEIEDVYAGLNLGLDFME